MAIIEKRALVYDPGYVEILHPLGLKAGFEKMRSDLGELPQGCCLPALHNIARFFSLIPPENKESYRASFRAILLFKGFNKRILQEIDYKWNKIQNPFFKELSNILNPDQVEALADCFKGCKTQNEFADQVYRRFAEEMDEGFRLHLHPAALRDYSNNTLASSRRDHRDLAKSIVEYCNFVQQIGKSEDINTLLHRLNYCNHSLYLAAAEDKCLQARLNASEMLKWNFNMVDALYGSKLDQSAILEFIGDLMLILELHLNACCKEGRIKYRATRVCGTTEAENVLMKYKKIKQFASIVNVSILHDQKEFLIGVLLNRKKIAEGLEKLEGWLFDNSTSPVRIFAGAKYFTDFACARYDALIAPIKQFETSIFDEFNQFIKDWIEIACDKGEVEEAQIDRYNRQKVRQLLQFTFLQHYWIARLLEDNVDYFFRGLEIGKMKKNDPLPDCYPVMVPDFTNPKIPDICIENETDYEALKYAYLVFVNLMLNKIAMTHKIMKSIGEHVELGFPPTPREYLKEQIELLWLDWDDVDKNEACYSPIPNTRFFGAALTKIKSLTPFRRDYFAYFDTSLKIIFNISQAAYFGEKKIIFDKEERVILTRLQKDLKKALSDSKSMKACYDELIKEVDNFIKPHKEWILKLKKLKPWQLDDPALMAQREEIFKNCQFPIKTNFSSDLNLPSELSTARNYEEILLLCDRVKGIASKSKTSCIEDSNWLTFVINGLEKMTHGDGNEAGECSSAQSSSSDSLISR